MTLAILTILGTFLTVKYIYTPLSAALETSLINNFSQVSLINYHSFQSTIQQSLNCAHNLSETSMNPEATEKYNNGEISTYEFILFIQPEFEKNTKGLKNLIIAERIINNTPIARYSPYGSKVSVFLSGKKVSISGDTDAGIYIIEDNIYYIVLSPIIVGKQIPGYDKLIFDLTAYMEELSTEDVDTSLVDEDTYKSLVSGSNIIRDDGELFLFNKSDYYYQSACLQNNFYLISRQSKETLLLKIHSLRMQILLTSLGSLLVFIIIVYLYLILYAKKELGVLETSHRALEKAVSEIDIDPLTKAFNRRCGTRFLDLSFKNYREKGFSPAIIIFDIDNFKSINDNYGHDMGDVILREVSDAIKSNTRKDDMLFRWGGDEFVGVFCGVEKDNIYSFISKIFNAISGIKAMAKSEEIKTTVSAGVSYFESEDEDYLDAFKRADKAMYVSKAQGRNKVNIL